jgi:hypothetical protein
MDFSFDDEQLAIAELAKQILTDASTQERMRELEKSGKSRFDSNLWKEMAESGLLGVGIDEAYGGAGLGFLELALVVEQVGRTTAAIPYIETAILGAHTLNRWGSDEQKDANLPQVVAGDLILTAALTEAEADPRTPTTQARDDGEGWRINGTKLCVPAGQLAQKILVPATTADGQIAIFLVDATAKGIAIEELVTTSRQPEAIIEFHDVAVSAADLVGDLDSGAAILDWVLDRGTSALCSLALGVCEVALDLTAEYTKTRKQFDQAIAMFQAVGQRAADAYVDTEGIRLTSWQAAWRLSVGMDASKAVAIAKFWAAEAGQRIVHAATHLHGGMGVDRDYPLHRHFLYAKSLELALGGSTAQLLTLGRLLADEEAA